MKLEELLQEMVDAKASDVFIIAGLPLTYEVGGRQIRLESAPFTPADTEMVRARHLRGIRPQHGALHCERQP